MELGLGTIKDFFEFMRDQHVGFGEAQMKSLRSLSIYHRDIKPDNVILTHDGHVKLTDFSVSDKILATGTSYYKIIGTPYYMAPELYNAWMDKESYCLYDPWETDLFSLGLTMIRLM